MHDGRNILSEVDIRTYDSVVLQLDNNEVVEVFERKEGSKAMIIGGKHSGELGEIEVIETVRSSRPNRIILKSLDDGTKFETIADYVFVVGEEKIELDLEDIREVFPDFDRHGRILRMDIRDIDDDFPALRSWMGYDLRRETPISGLYNVGDGVKPFGWEGLAACAEGARLVVAVPFKFTK